jgi:tetratricopeptide (TPR) repeat protein
MHLEDSRDLKLSTSSRPSLEAYEQAVELLVGYYLDPLARIDQALAEDPDFVSGHCLRAALGVLSWERAGFGLVKESLDAGARLASKANDRERRHFEAASAWLEGDFQRSVELYGKIVLDYPRDLLALQVAHVGDFALGQQRLLRDRIAHVLPHWSEQTPGFGFVLGMFAFGLEETNLFGMAETTARRGLERNRRDPWAVHAVAHVFEMTGRLEHGIDWLESRIDDWAPNNAFAYHNFWHLALYKLEKGDVESVLGLFDRHIWPKPSTVALELVDAASLLFRLYLRGVDIGRRAASVSDVFSDPSYHGYYAFNDCHAAMAFIADGRIEQARGLLAGLERAAGEDGSNAAMSRDVGLPLTRALVAFAEHRYDEVVDTLLPLRHVAHRFGGSNAQRDVIDQTLAEAAVRAGRVNEALALAAERRVLRPESPLARAIEERAQRVKPRAVAAE